MHAQVFTGLGKTAWDIQPWLVLTIAPQDTCTRGLACPKYTLQERPIWLSWCVDRKQASNKASNKASGRHLSSWISSFLVALIHSDFLTPLSRDCRQVFSSRCMLFLLLFMKKSFFTALSSFCLSHAICKNMCATCFLCSRFHRKVWQQSLRKHCFVKCVWSCCLQHTQLDMWTSLRNGQKAKHIGLTLCLGWDPACANRFSDVGHFTRKRLKSLNLNFEKPENRKSKSKESGSHYSH